MAVGPYKLGKEIQALIARSGNKERVIEEVARSADTTTTWIRLYLLLAEKLEPSIGESLDQNPTWVRRAMTLCNLPHEAQLRLHTTAERGHPQFGVLVQAAKRNVIRSAAQDCYDSLMMDEWPRNAARCDFGLDTPEHLGALQYAIRHGTSVYELDMVLGSGEKITTLCRSYRDNDYAKRVTFVTAWDKMAATEDPDDGDQ
jgi:hypothetical protein